MPRGEISNAQLHAEKEAASWHGPGRTFQLRNIKVKVIWLTMRTRFGRRGYRAGIETVS
jgi:hypothetical protein